MREGVMDADTGEQEPSAGGDDLIGASTTGHPLYEEVVEAVRTVYDPEIPLNLYELGLIYRIQINAENEVEIDMTLTNPACPVAGDMPGMVAEAVEPLPGVKTVDVRLVWDPPWDMSRLTDEARMELGFF